MQTQGVVFDFNGTLFWDTELQNRSWDEFMENYGLKLSPEEKDTWIHGINAKDTFEYLFKRPCSEEEVHRLTEEKEVIYRRMCLEQGLEWAPGALELIHFLKQNKVPIAIATASAKNNVDFFIQHMGLLDYFSRDHIIFNDGTSRGKPHPDLFSKAILSLGLSPQNVTIFEDSMAGVEAARNAGAGNVMVVNGTSERFGKYNYPIITHFEQVDRSAFLN